LRAQSEAQNDFPRLEILARTGEYASLDQRDHAVGHEFAVHPEILAIHQHGQYGIGNSADTRLQYRSIVNQPGNVPGDGHLKIIHNGLFQRAQRPRRLHERVNVVDVNEAVAVSTRHVVVDLRDNILRHFGRGQGSIHTDPKAAIAVRVRRRNLNQGHVNGHLAALEQPFDFAEIDGSVIGAAVVNGFAYVGADEHG